MTRIFETSVDAIIENLESPSECRPGDLDGFDIFITSLGFEERALAIPQLLSEPPQKAFVFTLQTNREDNGKNLPGLQQSLTGCDIEMLQPDVDKECIGSLIERLRGLSLASEHPLRILVDVSVMPSRVMLPIITGLVDFDCVLTIAYAMASIYRPTQDEYLNSKQVFCQSFDLTTEVGVEQINANVAFPGQHLDPLPACLVVFPNFRKERSIAVITETDESMLSNGNDQVFWLLTRPLNCDYEWRLDATKEVNGIRENAIQRTVDSIDYRDTIQVLDDIYQRMWRTHNISISPLGTKMQRLGVALFHYGRPSTRLIYTHPKLYNPRVWSEGIGQVFRVHLGETKTVRNWLIRLGALTIQ
jgi:hypothetical protein